MLSELRRELASLESKHEKAHEIVREASKENKSISGKLKLLNEGKFKLQRELQELERQMRETISVQTHDNEMIISQTQNEISAYHETIAHASQELVVLRQEKSELEEQQESFKRIEDEHKMQLQPLQAQLSKNF
jgi:chromosome segregation ATPase